LKGLSISLKFWLKIFGKLVSEFRFSKSKIESLPAVLRFADFDLETI
jgi:hypothetical protein